MLCSAIVAALPKDPLASPDLLTTGDQETWENPQVPISALDLKVCPTLCPHYSDGDSLSEATAGHKVGLEPELPVKQQLLCSSGTVLC